MSELDAINESIEHSKRIVETADAVKRLQKNADFNIIFTDGYLRDYAADMVQSKALYSMQDDKSQAFIDRQITGIGALSYYLDMLLTTGVTAQNALESQEEEKDYLIREEV